MLNYKSVSNSAPQIRSNPALRNASGFYEKLSMFLEPFPLPFPTFQIVKESSEPVLSQHPHYAWVRPAHLRSQWLIIADGLPLLMMDPKDHSRLSSLRVPFDKARVQHIGPIVCEGAWDAQDHILWIWDVVVWEKAVIWETMKYSKRWDLVKTIVGEILDCGHPMSDAEVHVPVWESLQMVRSRKDLDPAMSIEFQPEKAAQRRFVFIIRDEGVKFRPTTHHERKMLAEKPCAIVEDKEIHKEIHKEVHKEDHKETPKPKNKVIPVEKKGLLKKEKLPDTYRILSESGEDLGLAAIRSLGMSKELRELFKTNESISVTIMWYEPFQKYEVRQLHT